MKKFYISTLLLAAIVLRSTFVFASEGRIYISESDPHTQTTIISVLKPDGTTLKQIYIDGFLARISPDDKHIAYFKYNDGKDRLVLAGASGKKIKEFSLSKDKGQGNAFVPLKLIWSPDSTKVAILMQFKAYPFVLYLSVLNIKTSELNLVYSHISRNEIAPDKMEWLPDSKRILISREKGLEIIDPESKKMEEIIHTGSMACLIKNAENIVYAQLLQAGEMGGKPFSVWSYNVSTRESKKIINLPAPPSMVSQDGRYIVYTIFNTNLIVKGQSLFYFDVTNKKTTSAGTNDLILLAGAFSPNNTKLLCLGINPNKNENGNYYILDLKTGKLTFYKKSTVMPDNEALVLLAGYDLADIDWR